MIEQAMTDMPEGAETGQGIGGAGQSHDEALEAIETQLAVLVRSLELIRQRARDRPTQALDRAVYLMLRTLDVSGPLTVIALAAQLGLDPSTAARQVATMREKGLVSTRPDPRDRRAVLVSPTTLGLEQMREMQQARRASIADLVADWQPLERATFAHLLTRLNANIRQKRLQAPKTA